MSKKDVDLYYTEVTNQWMEMLQELKDFEKEAEKGLIEPERLEKIKETIQPLRTNYERWSYMMYLLNKPVRKKKQQKYQSQNKKKITNLDKSNSVESTLEENKGTLKTLKELTK